jgi:hypothetical protein
MIYSQQFSLLFGLIKIVFHLLLKKVYANSRIPVNTVKKALQGFYTEDSLLGCPPRKCLAPPPPRSFLLDQAAGDAGPDAGSGER